MFVTNNEVKEFLKKELRKWQRRDEMPVVVPTPILENPPE